MRAAAENKNLGVGSDNTLEINRRYSNDLNRESQLWNILESVAIIYRTILVVFILKKTPYSFGNVKIASDLSCCLFPDNLPQLFYCCEVHSLDRSKCLKQLFRPGLPHTVNEIEFCAKCSF